GQGAAGHQRPGGQQRDNDGGDRQERGGGGKSGDPDLGGEVERQHGERRERCPGEPSGGPRDCRFLLLWGHAAQHRHDHQQGRYHQAHNAEEHPVPAEHLRHDAGRERADQRWNHPRCRERREDFRVQDAWIDPGHQHVQRHRQGSAAESLHQPPGHKHRHRYRGAGDEQAQHEQSDRGIQRCLWPAPVRPVAGRHHTDNTGGHWTCEGQGVEPGAGQFPADQGHDGGHRQRLECGEEHQGTGADGHPQERPLQDAFSGVGGREGGIGHARPAYPTYRFRPAR
ncbi:hypothetical protein ARTHROSP310_39120, partial [Arthrobacter sp. AD-310]